MSVSRDSDLLLLANCVLGLFVDVSNPDVLGLHNLANLDILRTALAGNNVASLAQCVTFRHILQQRSAEVVSVSRDSNLLLLANCLGGLLVDVGNPDVLGLHNLANIDILRTALAGNNVASLAQFVTFRHILQQRSLEVVSVSRDSDLLLLANCLGGLLVDVGNPDVLNATICKRCKRHAHDNHEHSSQQSQQTSFKRRFLHVISPIH